MNKEDFNIFDYLDIESLAKDLKLNTDEMWILEKVDDRGTFKVRYE